MEGGGFQSPRPQPPAPWSGGRPHPNKAACAGRPGTGSASSGSARRRPGRARHPAPLRAVGSGAPQGGRAGGAKGPRGCGARAGRNQEAGRARGSGRARVPGAQARERRARPRGPRRREESRRPKPSPRAGNERWRRRAEVLHGEGGSERTRESVRGRRNRWLPWGAERGRSCARRGAGGPGSPGGAPGALTALELARAASPPSLRGRGEAAGAARRAAAEGPGALAGGARGARGGRGGGRRRCRGKCSARACHGGCVRDTPPPQSRSPWERGGTAVGRPTPSCCNSEESGLSPSFSSYYYYYPSHPPPKVGYRRLWGER